MFETGLVSISFRGSAPKEIAEAARGCGLSEIEWGSDVHVPAGDAETARAVRALTEQNGLRAGSYGTVSAKDTTPSHDITDEDALLALLEKVGALETVAPPTRKVNITELKKLPKVLQEAVERGVVSIEGSGEQTVTIKPSNAETKGAPKLARSIPSPAK